MCALTPRGSAVTVIAAAAMAAGCAWAPAASAAPSPTPLVPNDHGYVRIETESGSTGCSITTELVACQTSSDNWRDASGRVYHTVSVSADGELHWVDADLGELQGRVPLDDQTYSAQGWTIIASQQDTKFTNDLSGHGMSISDQRVTAF